MQEMYIWYPIALHVCVCVYVRLLCAACETAVMRTTWCKCFGVW